MKENYNEFIEEITTRGIEYLVHFTPTINLLGIFEQQNLLSRDIVESMDTSQIDLLDYVEFTDEYRFDDKAYINLSIQHPNSYLLNRFMEKTKDELHISWCVLKINPKYIYKQETLFSVTNAANSYNKNVIGITGDISKFKLMFSPELPVVTSYAHKLLTRDNLLPKYPTDEQAEVLVKGQISMSDILEVCFVNKEELAACKAACDDFDTSNFVVDSTLFTRNRV